MKKLFLLLTFTLVFTCCEGEKKELLEISLSTSSVEAKDIFINDIFKPKETFRINSPLVDDALEKILKLDPNFYFAKAFYGYTRFNLKPFERQKLISEAYENITNVSEIEAAVISSLYELIVSGNIPKAEGILNDIVKKYPDHYYLRIFIGHFQNIEAKNPNASKISWEEALRIDPNNSLAKLLLSQLHYVTTTNFQLLEKNSIDLNYAIELIKEVAIAEPNNFICPRLLGNIYRARGEFDKSISEYENAMKIINDDESIETGRLLLVNAHNYVFKKEYEKARELYKKSIEVGSKYNSAQRIFTALWSTETFLYDKKYGGAIKAIAEVEKSVIENDDYTDIQKNQNLYFCDFQRFLAYGHSQMKEETLSTLSDMNEHLEIQKGLSRKIANSESQRARIELELTLNQEFNKIWYLILFGEYENAFKKLESYSQLSSKYLIYDSKAMVNFYKLSGYLNLMSGNPEASISFYDQIPKELLEGDQYHLYFYALAKKALGDNEKSQEIFKGLANYNFAGWENALVRSLAKDQISS